MVNLPSERRYGPDDPHPLSTLRAELVWEGKYDEFGNRREAHRIWFVPLSAWLRAR